MTDRLVLTPTDFVAITNQVLDTSFGFIYLQGEISQFRISKQKWVYFDIKDEFSKVKCFASIYAMPGPLEDGMLVRIGGSPKMHPQFGFSITVQNIKPVGEGSIHQALAMLKAKLEKQGLFLPERKRQLPEIPSKIALVTSIESAAYADFIKISGQRWPYLDVFVFDTLVQGENAPLNIVKAIQNANSQTDLADVLLVTRGGGSADDLAAFNDERVVKAIAASRIPTMVAIGHEVDESLSELAADKRASTPSNAAELLVPDRLSESLEISAYNKHFAKSAMAVTALESQNLKLLSNRLENATIGLIDKEKSDINSTKHLVESYNPENVLKRGYAMVKNDDGKLVETAKMASKLEKLDIIFRDGGVKVRKA